MFNLSLLTSDMWVVVFRIFLFHQQVIPLLKWVTRMAIQYLIPLFGNTLLSGVKPNGILSSNCRLTGYTTQLLQLQLLGLSYILQRMFLIFVFCILYNMPKSYAVHDCARCVDENSYHHSLGRFKELRNSQEVLESFNRQTMQRERDPSKVQNAVANGNW